MKPNLAKPTALRKGLYRHFKGNYYQVLHVATDSENKKAMVVYRALYGDKNVWTRSISMFTEVIERDGVEQTRFTWCDDQTLTLEVAIIDIHSSQEAEFEASFTSASQVIASVNGYVTHSLERCIEQENRYLLLVEWQALEDHTIGFRESEQYQQWRDLLHHFFSL